MKKWHMGRVQEELQFCDGLLKARATELRFTKLFGIQRNIWLEMRQRQRNINRHTLLILQLSSRTI